MPITKEKTIGGYLVEKKDGEIEAIIASWGEFRVGGRVMDKISNQPAEIFSVELPYSRTYTTHTSDVIRILHDGEKLPIRRKIDEIEP